MSYVSFNAWSRSLSNKIIAVFATALLALLAVLWLTLGMTFERLLNDNIKPYLTHHLSALKNQIGTPPDLSVARRLAEQNPVIIEIEGPGYQWSSNGVFVEREEVDLRLQRFSGEEVMDEAGFYDGNFILRTYDQGYVISFIITEKLNNQLERRALLWAVIAIVAIVAVLYFVILKIFSPIKTIHVGVQRIGNGEVSHRLSVSRHDEFGLLSQSINKMADNIEQMLDAKRQMLLAISHELRTPITRTKLALSMFDDEVNQDSIAEDMDEMESLIEELLESERLRSNHAALDFQRVNVNEIIYQVQGRFFDKAPLVMTLDANLPEVEVDASRIGLAVKNVIKNAITASLSPDDKVMISTSVRDNCVAVSVTDLGRGIEPEAIPHLTEPFYRPDRSRQRKTGGCGIGLHLIKAILDAHHGQLQIESDVGRGTTVTLLLPMTS